MTDFIEIVRSKTKQNIGLLATYFRLIHAQNVMTPFLIFIVGMKIGGINLAASLKDIISGFLVIFFTYSFGSIVNDIYDIEIDRINSPERPLPSGRINISLAKKLAYLNLIASLLLSGFLLEAEFLPFVILFLVCGVIYSIPKLGRISAKGWQGLILLTISYYVLPYLMGLQISRGFSLPAILLLIGMSTFAASKLLLKDFKDQRGDLIYKKMTPLINIGVSLASKLFYVFAGVGFVLILISLNKIITPGYFNAFLLGYFITYLSLAYVFFANNDRRPLVLGLICWATRIIILLYIL